MINPNPVVSRGEWIAARKLHLVKEKEMTENFMMINVRIQL